MLLYIDGKPQVLEPKSANPFGFVRLINEKTREYVATLPARFIRQGVGSIVNNGKTYAFSDHKGVSTYIESTIYTEGLHAYAYYFHEKHGWKESASLSNVKLREIVKEKRKRKP